MISYASIRFRKRNHSARAERKINVKKGPPPVRPECFSSQGDEKCIEGCDEVLVQKRFNGAHI